MAVNSFKELKGLYDNPSTFHKKSLAECSPHIYALSEKAYSSLIATGLNQSFIISGESGAGKTESMKFICRYMAHLKDEMNNVQTNILNVNVVLEAFGNAKTVYNNNSSRFVSEIPPLLLSCFAQSLTVIRADRASSRNYNLTGRAPCVGPESGSTFSKSQGW